LERAAIDLAGVEAGLLFDELGFIGIGVLAESVEATDFGAEADFEGFGDGDVDRAPEQIARWSRRQRNQSSRRLSFRSPGAISETILGFHRRLPMVAT
jgi:hypothetical protein